MKDPEPHRQREAWIPRLFARVNAPRTRELIPPFAALPRAEKIAKAVGLFRRLAEEDPNSGMRPSRRWSLEYFEACAEGAAARRQFLVDEGVFGPNNRLVVPGRVQQQMELGNLDPTAYPESLRQEVDDLSKLMFHEYFGVKNLLSFPDAADLVAWIAERVSLARRVVLPRPRLKLSLLLRDYVGRIVSEARRNSDPPLVAIFGPGKGEELVPLFARGLSVVCLDAHDAGFIKDLLHDTFAQSLTPQPPELVVLGEGGAVDASVLSAWKTQGCAPTIFVVSGVDAADEELIPGPLHGVASVAASIYLLHELRHKEALFANMARISGGSVVVFDGLPSVEGLDNVILPVSERHDAVVTGHDAVITHLLCLPPDEMEAIAKRAVPDIDWKGVVVGPPIPPPLFYKLQGAVVGRRS